MQFEIDAFAFSTNTFLRALRGLEGWNFKRLLKYILQSRSCVPRLDDSWRSYVEVYLARVHRCLRGQLSLCFHILGELLAFGCFVSEHFVDYGDGFWSLIVLVRVKDEGCRERWLSLIVRSLDHVWKELVGPCGGCEGCGELAFLSHYRGEVTSPAASTIGPRA